MRRIHSLLSWSRLALCAVIIGSAMLAGYAAGIALIVRRLERAEQLPLTDEFRSFVGPISVFRYPYHSRLFASPPNIQTDYAMWFGIALTLTFIAFFGTMLARLVPLAAVAGRLEGVSPDLRKSLRGELSDILRHRPVPILPVSLFALAAGFTGAMIGEAHAYVFAAIESEAAWARGAPGSADVPRPTWGIFASYDLLWVFIWTAALPAVGGFLSTRARFRSSPVVLQQLCPRCGYPRGAQRVETQPKGLTCPECGADYASIRRRRRPAFLYIGVTALVALALLLHFGAPSIAMRIMGG